MSSLAYPLTVAFGDLVLVNDEAEIAKDAIESSVMTLVDERVRNPDYGRSFDVFSTINDYGNIARSVRLSVEYGTVGYDLGSITVSAYPSGEVSVVEIGYAINDATSIFTLGV